MANLRGEVTVTFKQAEVLALLKSPDLPTSVNRKVLKAFQQSAVRPIGAKASAFAAAKKNSTRTATAVQQQTSAAAE
jgi:hypothetical protein